MTENKAFHSGEYHQLRDFELSTDPKLAERNIDWLLRMYGQSERLILSQGWQYPLAHGVVDILHMGVEGHHTARTFAQFVQERNPNANITIADFSKKALTNLRLNGIEKLPNVEIIQADTTKLHFPDESFNLIETDGLLQFLSPQNKTQALSEWYRVLKPGGVVTTRDTFVSIQEPPSQWDALNRWRQNLYDRLGVHTFPSTVEVMRYKFTEQGFEPVFHQLPPKPSRVNIRYAIVARKPEGANK